jgi:hypothetical protein
MGCYDPRSAFTYGTTKPSVLVWIKGCRPIESNERDGDRVVDKSSPKQNRDRWLGDRGFCWYCLAVTLLAKVLPH